MLSINKSSFVRGSAPALRHAPFPVDRPAPVYPEGEAAPLPPRPGTDASLNPPAVGKAAVQGAGWVLLFSGVGKVVTLGSQLVLAWLLLPEAFGLGASAGVGADLLYAMDAEALG